MLDCLRGQLRKDRSMPGLSTRFHQGSCPFVPIILSKATGLGGGNQFLH